MKGIYSSRQQLHYQYNYWKLHKVFYWRRGRQNLLIIFVIILHVLDHFVIHNSHAFYVDVSRRKGLFYNNNNNYNNHNNNKKRNNVIFQQQSKLKYIRNWRHSINFQQLNAADEIPNRIRDVQFISPLLEYGYLPAVDEYIAIQQHKQLQQQQQQQQQQHSLSSNKSMTMTTTTTTTIKLDTTTISNSRKPILLFLPGFDGTYLSPFLHFPELQTSFDVRCMITSTKDRSTYDELLTSVLNFLHDEIHGEIQYYSTTIETATTKTTTATVVDDNNNDNIESTSSNGRKGNLTENELNTTVIKKTTLSDNNNNTSNLWIDIIQGTSNLIGNIVNVGGSKSTVSVIDNTPVYLVGESFGGILASDAAITILNNNANKTTTNTTSSSTIINKQINIQGLILINSATCYDRSRLAVEGANVLNMPRWLYPFYALRLLPLFTDDYSVLQLLAILQGRALPSVIDNAIRETYLGRVAFSLPFKIPIITQDVLQWRLQSWLSIGCEKMTNKNRLGQLRTKYPTFRTLIIAGEDDRCLPSIAEAQRLSVVLPNSVVHIVPGAGHSSTCGSRIDLAAVIRKRYPELCDKISNNWNNNNNNNNKNKKITSASEIQGNKKLTFPVLRTSMKDSASSNTGVLFGMEPRYDNNTIGISPLLYWSKKYFKKYNP